MSRDALTWSGGGHTVYIEYDRAVTAAAIEFLATRDLGDRPLCLVVGYVLPHCPYIAPPHAVDRFLPLVGVPQPTSVELENEHAVLANERSQFFADINVDDARRSRAAYYGLVEELDANVSRVLDALSQRGIRDDSLVVYTSDHGELAGEHGMWWKSSFYEASVRVPLIVTWPDRVRQESIVRRVVSLLDLGATLLDLGGAPNLPNSNGRSLRRFLATNGEDRWDDEVFAELSSATHSPRRMVRKGRWKLNVYAGDPNVQLFDLEADPGEVLDLGRAPEYDVVRRELLRVVLDGWDPVRMIERLAARLADRALISKWESIYALRTHRPSHSKVLWPESWSAPRHVNRFAR
jgi:choline-sulfatase